MVGQFHDRHSLTSLAHGDEGDPAGRLFATYQGLKDLSGINIVGSSVDTLRQLYHGVVREAVLSRLSAAIGDEREFIEFDGEVFHLARMGKKSGYQYKLQNNELGVIILLKSAFAEHDTPATHMKIELSHHVLLHRAVTPLLVRYGRLFLEKKHLRRLNGVAIHLAVDVQGWEMPRDFLARFVTRTRQQIVYDGVDNVDFAGLSTASVTYGDRESFLFGKAAALQFCIYRKDIEIVKSKKTDYYHNYWKEHSDNTFDPEKPVWRLELRFHHSVTREIGNGLNLSIDTWDDVFPLLTSLWQYGLRNNRLNSDDKC